MKRNVDLTEDMTFSGGDFLNVAFIDVWNKTWKEPCPWRKSDNSCPEFDYPQQKNNIIIVGDKKIREEIKIFKGVEQGDRCDCCGSSLKQIPWTRYDTLCERCYKELEKRYKDKCLWRIEDEVEDVRSEWYLS